MYCRQAKENWRGKARIFLLLLIVALAAGYWAWPAWGQKPTLYWGSTGADVRLLQKRLSDWGYYRGPIDGIYGPETWRAVRDFQSKNGLTVDGIVGPETWAAVGYGAAPAGAVAVTSRGVSQGDDIELLARLINGEARGEPYVGQVAVGAVVINRVRHPSFPKTLAGVIFQPGAFSAVTDGQINLAPTSDARRAAIDAISGWDPTYGCIYYYNPAKATSAWIWSRPRVITIGNHIFCR